MAAAPVVPRHRRAGTGLGRGRTAAWRGRPLRWGRLPDAASTARRQPRRCGRGGRCGYCRRLWGRGYMAVRRGRTSCRAVLTISPRLSLVQARPGHAVRRAVGRPRQGWCRRGPATEWVKGCRFPREEPPRCEGIKRESPFAAPLPGVTGRIPCRRGLDEAASAKDARASPGSVRVASDVGMLPPPRGRGWR